jgi:nucleolysin TIA-1/TIAR
VLSPRRDKADAEQAISTMNGEWLGSRAIRVNWANQKTQTGGSRVGFGGAPAPSNFQGGPLDYETVANQTGAFNTTVYVGNLIPYSTQADLIPLFQGYGYIVEIRMQADRGFAFVKLDTHEHAAQAIVNLQNYPVHGRPIKCSWGKDREGGALGSGPAVGPAVVSPAQGVVPLQQPGMGMMGGYPTMVSVPVRAPL